MASLSRQHANAVAALLKSQQRPQLPLLQFSEVNDFKVAEARSSLFREVMGTEVHTFVQLGPRIQHPNASPDRCGIIAAFQCWVSIAKKLTTQATETQPADENEMDAVREYAEWIQDVLWQNRYVNERSLSTLDAQAMPDLDYLSGGMYVVQYSLEYI